MEAGRVTEVAKESMEFYIGTIEEASGGGADGEYTVEFLRAGLTADGRRFYPPNVLKRAAESGVFDGRKMYCGHETAADKMRGYRDVEKWWATTIPGSVTVSESGNLRARVSVCSSVLGEKLANPHARKEMGTSHDSQYRYKFGDTHGQNVEEVLEIPECNSIDFVPDGNAFGRVLEARRTEGDKAMADQNGNVQEGFEERLAKIEGNLEGLSDKITDAVKAAMAPEEEPVPEVAEATTEPSTRLTAEVERLARKDAARDVLATATDLSDETRARVLESIVAGGADPQEAIDAERAYIDGIVKESGGAARVTGAGAGQTTDPTEYNKETQTKLWREQQNMSAADAEKLWDAVPTE